MHQQKAAVQLVYLPEVSMLVAHPLVSWYRLFYSGYTPITDRVR